jgi:hypothetical protein
MLNARGRGDVMCGSPDMVGVYIRSHWRTNIENGAPDGVTMCSVVLFCILYMFYQGFEERDEVS